MILITIMIITIMVVVVVSLRFGHVSEPTVVVEKIRISRNSNGVVV
jgi:hypothetical protein